LRGKERQRQIWSKEGQRGIDRRAMLGTEADLSKEDKRDETVGSKERKRGSDRLTMLETEADLIKEG
jgi:hypothetical protein